MYRPPENANRVQAIRNIFESKEQVTTPPKLIAKSKTELDLRCHSRCHQNLNRQLSDPSKRNIKRTPAFRLDKNAIAEKNPIRYHSKVKHDCDKARSKCLDDEALTFSDIRSRFSCNQSNTSEMSSTNVMKNISFLYAEPIPKALRVKTCDTPPPAQTKSDDESYYCNRDTLKLKEDDAVSLTDTLKSALKKPLPAGPAPKKPPRTFLHSPGGNVLPLNIDKDFTDALNKKLQKNTTPARGKGDPKYMLDKLENMLKKKQNRVRKAGKTDSEDSDDAFPTTTTTRFTSNNTSNTLPNNNNSPSQLFNNLNCLHALGCSAATYERINEPNSSFFVECRRDEPVYAEPFQFRENANRAKQKERKKSTKEQRNSLYYMVCLFRLQNIYKQIQKGFFFQE